MEEKIKITKEFIFKKQKWIILFICLIIVIAITEDVFSKEIMNLDKIGYQLISKYLINDFVTPIAKTVTRMGGAMVLITCTLLSIFLAKNKKIGLCISLNLLISTALNLILKNLVQRPRPIEYRLIDETGYSFPSGHSMVSTAFYGFIIYLIYNNVKNKKIRFTLIALLSILILTIGTSRIYLGVHYTSDVIAGFLISISYLVIYISVLGKTILKE